MKARPASVPELGAESNLNRTRYYPVVGTRGVVVAGHPLAAASGARILMEGGNAVDAGLAASAVLAVVRPQMCGLGGDLFLLVYRSADRSVRAINGNGAAPLEVDRRSIGDELPRKGPLAATVPGLVAGWEAAAEKFASRPLESLLDDAIEYAEHGFPVYARLRHWIECEAAVYRRFRSSADLFLPSGAVPVEGSLFRQEDLAGSLKSIARNGPREFYEGELGERLAAAVRADGGALSVADLRAQRVSSGAPIVSGYRGCRVFETPPTSQGYMVLEALNVLAQVLEPELPVEDVIHVMVETKKLVFEERLELFGDPDFVALPLSELLDPAHAAELAARIAPAGRHGVLETIGEETAVLLAVDSERNAVAAIQSNFYDSGYVAGGTGILLSGRLQGFSLEPQSPNALEPGKRPVSTLNVWMVTDRAGRLRYVGGSPGGHGQVQTNMQVLHLLLDRGLPVQEAVEAPRWVHGDLRREGRGDELALESRFDERVFRALAARGHRVHALPDWAEMSTGSAKVIAVEGEVLKAGVDPRRDAYAVVY